MTFPRRIGPGRDWAPTRIDGREGYTPKGFRPKEIIAKLREADVLLGQGKKVVKALGVSEVTHYRWRQEYGGMSVSQAKRLKKLERGNAWLRKAVADLALDKMILQEAARGN